MYCNRNNSYKKECQTIILFRTVLAPGQLCILTPIFFPLLILIVSIGILDLRNLQEQVKKVFSFKNCTDLSLFKYIVLKVSKFQNEFMKSSFLPKYEPNIVRISALYCATLHSEIY